MTINSRPSIQNININRWLWIRKKSAGLKHYNDPNTFIKHSNDSDDNYKNIYDYNLNKRRKVLLVFNNMIADMISNKKPIGIITEVRN